MLSRSTGYIVDKLVLTHDSAETKGTGGFLLVLGWSELSGSLRSSSQTCIVLREKPRAHLPSLTPATLG